jgi:predicted N-formylglutamate amidohydrolase
VVVCDHASSRIPPEYGFLGLSAAERLAHIAWDPGALEMSLRLAELLDAPLVYSTVSRLVVDCNRSLDAPDLIAAVSETTAIPGNAKLSAGERRHRIAAVHEPYHAAIDALLEQRMARPMATALIGIHTFTPVYRGVARHWQVGVIFQRDRRLADRLIDSFRAEGLNVGVNQPYSPAEGVYYTIERHGEARGLPCVMVEIRNDLVAAEAERHQWAARLARALGGFTPAALAV